MNVRFCVEYEYHWGLHSKNKFEGLWSHVSVSKLSSAIASKKISIGTIVVKCPSCRTENKLKEKKELFQRTTPSWRNIENSKPQEENNKWRLKHVSNISINLPKLGLWRLYRSIFLRNIGGKVHSVGSLRNHMKKLSCSENIFQVSCPKRPSKTTDLEKIVCFMYGVWVLSVLWEDRCNIRAI